MIDKDILRKTKKTREQIKKRRKDLKKQLGEIYISEDEEEEIEKELRIEMEHNTSSKKLLGNDDFSDLKTPNPK